MTPSPRPLHVVVLADWLRFPRGMAASQRVRLLARGLAESGVAVRVLVLQAGERPPHVENVAVRGVVDGVAFEHACGTTLRAPSFLARRRVEARGWLAGAARLVALRRAGQLDVVYLWFTSQRLQARRLAYLVLLRLLRVPVVVELNERPWPLRADRRPQERLLSPLAGVVGAVSISRFLSAWAREEATRRRQRLALLEVPIVVDVDEQEPPPYPDGPPLLVLAAAPEYVAATRFVLAALARVWEERPDCRLVLTGLHPGEPDTRRLLAGLPRDGRLEVAGYLPRPELLALYGRAHALLVPLFADVRSRARFPTKLGEYLAAARPVVTSRVGEAARWLRDGEEALLCPPGDVEAYAAAVLALLRDPGWAAAVGAAGRRLARERFHYAVHGPRLARWLAAVAAGAAEEDLLPGCEAGGGEEEEA